MPKHGVLHASSMEYAVSCRGGARCLTMAAKQCLNQKSRKAIVILLTKE